MPGFPLCAIHRQECCTGMRNGLSCCSTISIVVLVIHPLARDLQFLRGVSSIQGPVGARVVPFLTDSSGIMLTFLPFLVLPWHSRGDLGAPRFSDGAGVVLDATGEFCSLGPPVQ